MKVVAELNQFYRERGVGERGEREKRGGRDRECVQEVRNDAEYTIKLYFDI